MRACQSHQGFNYSKLAATVMLMWVMLLASCQDYVDENLGYMIYEESPNDQYEAHAISYYSSPPRYEFEVRKIKKTQNTRSDKVIIKHTIRLNSKANTINFREEGVITWKADSSAVSFGDGTNIIWRTSVP